MTMFSHFSMALISRDKCCMWSYRSSSPEMRSEVVKVDIIILERENIWRSCDLNSYNSISGLGMFPSPAQLVAKWPIIAVFKESNTTTTLSNWFLATATVCTVMFFSYAPGKFMPMTDNCITSLGNFWKMNFFSSSSSAVTVFTGFAATRDQKSWKISSASLNDLWNLLHS